MAKTESFSPRVVEPSDLYDGPEPPPAEPRINFIPPKTDVRKSPNYVAVITAGLDILNARLLALVAIVAACTLWGLAVYQPEMMRTYAALGFSLTVLGPVIVLCFKRG